jgi:chromosome segregation ATPase
MEYFIGIFTNWVNIVFFILIGIFVYLDIRNNKLNIDKDYKASIVTIGIVGTFVGVVLGLKDFDSNDMDRSIPLLLDGLKTAFATSIAGMFSSLALFVFQKPKELAKTELSALNNINLNIKELIELVKNQNNQVNNNTLLTNINTTIEKTNISIESLIKYSKDHLILTNEFSNNEKKQSELLENIIQGNENQTEIFNTLNESLSQGIEQINTNLDKAIEKLSKGATEEIIKALENVIKDFNHNLQEQFGDNFQQLNESTKNMIEWQHNYKDHIEKLEESFEKSNNLIEKSATSLEQINSNFQNIDVTFNGLSDIVKTVDHQIKDIEKHLSTLNQIGEKSKLYIDEIAKFSDTTKESLTNQTVILSNLIEKSSKLNSELESQMAKSLQELNGALTSLTRQFKDDYEFFLTKVSNLIKMENKL